ncbi:hypothetical protein V8G54_009377 [Vigna mungo]|uniref:GAG-pre-integrase domain-containing protein n=1 Tax=Vigna mungo TaxID=3915 RepID=A0AAQ3NUD5_VIGMU
MLQERKREEEDDKDIRNNNRMPQQKEDVPKGRKRRVSREKKEKTKRKISKTKCREEDVDDSCDGAPTSIMMHIITYKHIDVGAPSNQRLWPSSLELGESINCLPYRRRPAVNTDVAGLSSDLPQQCGRLQYHRRRPPVNTDVTGLSSDLPQAIRRLFAAVTKLFTIMPPSTHIRWITNKPTSIGETTTSHDLWTLLQRTYAKASRSHLKQLKKRFHTVPKGTQSITTYMHSLKQTAYLLASLGSLVSIEDMTDRVLCGLDDGYRVVIDGVNARNTPILFYDLLEKLLIQELSLVVAQRQVSVPMTALNAQTRPNHYDKTRSRQFFASSTSRPDNRKPFLGRCQWCNVKGNVLSQYHTFKQQHPGVSRCLLVQVHTATVATSQNNCLVDSGVTHHVTNDLDNLTFHHPYKGPNSLFMGNGSVHSVRTDSSASWHYRLGHPSSSIFTFIQHHFSLGWNKFQQSNCNSCQINKCHKLPFNESTLKSSYPLEIIFSDVWTSPVLSIDGLRYYCMFVDHFTRYIWLYPIKRKSDVQTLFPKFKSLLENFFHRNTDNGGEYIGLCPFLCTHGIILEDHMLDSPAAIDHRMVAAMAALMEIPLALVQHTGPSISVATAAA